jgi:hypothetical protein
MEVVIAQDDPGLQSTQAAQDPDRIGPPVDEITHRIEAVLATEPDGLQQPLE